MKMPKKVKKARAKAAAKIVKRIKELNKLIAECSEPKPVKMKAIMGGKVYERVEAEGYVSMSRAA